MSDDFFDELANTSNIALFGCLSIQAMIDRKWPLAREYTIKLLFAPFLTFHVIFVIYSNVFIGQYELTEGLKGTMYVVSFCLYILSLYFMQNEIRQIYFSGFEYFTSIWNYADIIPPCLIVVIVSIHLKLLHSKDIFFFNNTALDEDGVSNTDGINYSKGIFNMAGVAAIHSIASLLMWVKFIYFLRIFKSTGKL